jgi:DNA-binding CsgD family transcriptional regulator
LGGGGLDRLTHRERRVLRLLASGHSVKSAAAEEGISENAASELLRSARRKLGTGSSREAARLLAAHGGEPQKIRDEKSVLPISATDRRSGAGFSKGSAAMIVTALAATAAIAFIVQGGGLSNTSESQGGQAVREETPAGDQIVPTGAPKVVGTVPSQGAVIAPGPFRLAVIFDRPMAPGSYAFAHDAAHGPFPQCAGQPQLSPDGRTYTLDCVASAGERYVIYFNRQPHIGFLDAATQTPAQEARLEFAVSSNAVSAPRVVRTVPADGAEIGVGSFTVEVTFDQPMLPQAYSFVRSDEGLYPECPSPPRLSADGRTYSLECVARQQGKYVMYFNRPPYMNFREAETQTSAEPARLAFTVRGG